jgi:hypothetical protein
MIATFCQSSIESGNDILVLYECRWFNFCWMKSYVYVTITAFEHYSNIKCFETIFCLIFLLQTLTIISDCNEIIINRLVYNSLITLEKYIYEKASLNSLTEISQWDSGNSFAVHCLPLLDANQYKTYTRVQLNYEKNLILILTVFSLYPT